MTNRMGALALLGLIAAGAAGCANDPVSWSDVSYSSKENPPAGQVHDAERVEVPDRVACRSSIQIARSGKTFYAVWWSARPDSSSALEFSRSADGGPWATPVTVATGDHSTRGCDRPPPSVAADPVSGYVHLSYFTESLSGAGVFSAHTMDGGASFHAAIPINFGNRASHAALAAQGNRVAVAYEDPNAPRTRIFVALSRSMGHIFELKLPVSDANSDAADPRVELRGSRLEVSWTERASADSTRQRHASRIGIWK